MLKYSLSIPANAGDLAELNPRSMGLLMKYQTLQFTMKMLECQIPN
jgi:hypothetical protein